MERAPRCPSPHPQMEMATTDRPPQLRSRRVWSQKWLIRYFRKRSFFPPYVCSASRRASQKVSTEGPLLGLAALSLALPTALTVSDATISDATSSEAEALQIR